MAEALPVREAARRLRVSESTVRRRIRRGELVAHRAATRGSGYLVELPDAEPRAILRRVAHYDERADARVGEVRRLGQLAAALRDANVDRRGAVVSVVVLLLAVLVGSQLGRFGARASPEVGSVSRALASPSPQPPALQEGPAMPGAVEEPATPSAAVLVSSPAITSPAPAASPAPTAPSTLLDERFADNSRNWPNDPGNVAWLADGSYHLFAREPGQFVGIRAPIAQTPRDVVVTATYRKTGGPPGGGYGIIVRDQASGGDMLVGQTGRFYVLEVGDRGDIGIWRREGNRWVDLVPWRASTAVRPGNEPNELTVRAIGSRLTMVVNGVEVASQDDPVLSAGGVGIFAGGDQNQVLVQRFTIEVIR